jgi:hypothetical protein
LLEIARILKVAGNPYEPDHGTPRNDESTAEEGILVINCYDWSCYDARSLKELNDDEVEPGQDGPWNSIGLVDLKDAAVPIPIWKAQSTAKRESAEFGTWIFVPRAEYLFGRFGLDEERKQARSFLFFAGHACFTEAAFEGLTTPVRKFETGVQRVRLL